MKFSRRHLLAGVAAASVAPLAACPADRRPEPSGEVTPTPTATPSPSPSRLPFGLETPSTIDAVVFDGAFGTSYVRQAGTTLSGLHPGVTVEVTSSADIASDLSGRFDGAATPPDLIDNSGAAKLPTGSMVEQFAELDDLLEVDNLEGIPIGETLYHGVADAGTYDGRFIGLNYALSVYGLWHAGSTFASQGWAIPATWDEMLLLGEEAARTDRHLFVWGEDAASYYHELAISSAIKEGGHEVRVALDNLASDGWGHPALTMVLEQLEECVNAGFMLAGGPYLDAQARWSRYGDALLYPCGSWIEREMGGTAPETFDFTVAPVPTLTAAPMLPISAIHSAPTEQFLVPKDAANPAGGLELLRVMLSREAAASFARTNLIPTVVRGIVPTDVESTSLASQTALLANAGEHVFTWRFTNHYGLGQATNALWAEFLSGQIRSAELAERLQALSDAIREDPDVERYTVS